MSRGVSLRNRPTARSVRGQSLVEFAFISFLLFMLLLGIIEMGRFLFTYSVISNAAQEGSRYGIVRPRDVYNVSAAATARAQGTQVPTQIVVSDFNCNVIDKTREKVFGIPVNEVQVAVWYDEGDGTPRVPNASPTTQRVIQKGNRIVVETTYKFFFIVPFVSRFMPNGIDVKMRSARSMMADGDSPVPPCVPNLTPAPFPTFTPTPTATETIPPPPSTSTPFPTWTPTLTAAPTETATITPTATSTSTPCPVCTPEPTPTTGPTNTATVTNTPTVTPTPLTLVITRVLAVKENGNGKPLGVEVDVTDGMSPFPFATVLAKVYRDGVHYVDANLPLLSGGTYQECPSGVFNAGHVITVDVFVSAPGYTSTSRLGTIAVLGNYLCR